MALGDIAPSLYSKVKNAALSQHIFCQAAASTKNQGYSSRPKWWGVPWQSMAESCCAVAATEPWTHGPMDQGESFEWQGGQDPSATGEAELWLFGDYLEVGQRHSCCSFLVFPSLVPKCDCWVWSGVGAWRMQGIRNRNDISWNPVVYRSEQSSLEFFPAV